MNEQFYPIFNSACTVGAGTRLSGDKWVAHVRWSRIRQKEEKPSALAELRFWRFFLSYKALKKNRKEIPIARIATIGVLGLAVTGLSLDYFSPHARQYRANQASAKLTEANAKIAHFRYDSGCIMPLTGDRDANGYLYKVASLAEGTQVFDPNTSLPLPSGELVCNDRGMTYEVKEGVLSDPKRATDMDRVQRRYQAHVKWNPNAHRSEVNSK